LGGFLKFLHDKYGVARVKEVWQSGSQGIPQVFGKSLAELEQEWREALVQQFPKPPTRHYRSTAGAGANHDIFTLGGSGARSGYHEI
jgi:hypothetical protein